YYSGHVFSNSGFGARGGRLPVRAGRAAGAAPAPGDAGARRGPARPGPRPVRREALRPLGGGAGGLERRQERVVEEGAVAADLLLGEAELREVVAVLRLVLALLLGALADGGPQRGGDLMPEERAHLVHH